MSKLMANMIKQTNTYETDLEPSTTKLLWGNGTAAPGLVVPTSLGFRVANFRFFLWRNGTAAPGLVIPTSLGFRVANFQKRKSQRIKLVQFRGCNFSVSSRQVEDMWFELFRIHH